MKYYSPIVADLIECSPLPVAVAKQGDTARGAIVALTASGSLVELNDETVRIFAKKKDGNIVYNDCVVENGKVKIDYTSQLLALPGYLQMEIEVTGSDGVISTPIFILQVLPSNINSKAIESTNEFDVLQDKLLANISTDIVINWDFDPTEREMYTDSGNSYYKACDLPCSLDELKNGILYISGGAIEKEIYLKDNPEVLTQVEDNAYKINAELAGIGFSLGFIVLHDTSENSRGIYTSSLLGNMSVYLIVPRSSLMSWGRLWCKPFYEYIGEPTEIQPPVTIDFSYDGEKWKGIIDNPEAHLVSDRLYTVTYDGMEHKCLGQHLGDSVYVIGNAVSVGGKSNNEPFMVKYDYIENSNRYTVYDYSDSTASSTHTISIAESFYELKQLDPKFIPDGTGLPEVSAADNNRVLGVENGEWKLVEQTGGETGGSGESVQSDYKQNDSSKSDYIKNRPFYTEEGEDVDFLAETTIALENMDGVYGWQQGYENGPNLIEGETYHVVWGDEEYECKAVSVIVDSSAPPYIILGNPAIIGLGDDTGETFLFGNQYAEESDGIIYGVYIFATSEVVTSKKVRIYQSGEIIHPLDVKYLPKDDIIAMIDAYMEDALGGDY